MKTPKQLVAEAIDAVKNDNISGPNKVAFVLGYVNGGERRLGDESVATLVRWLSETERR